MELEVTAVTDPVSLNYGSAVIVGFKFKLMKGYQVGYWIRLDRIIGGACTLLSAILLKYKTLMKKTLHQECITKSTFYCPTPN